MTPMPFFEGKYEQRIKYLKEIPAGKIIGWFDRSDFALLKKELGDTMCIMGGMPASLLQTGTRESVSEYTKQLIETFNKESLIMNSSTVLDEADPELVKAWVEATRKYGS